MSTLVSSKSPDTDDSELITLRALLTARGPFQQSIAALALGHIDFSSLNRRHLVPTVDRLLSFCSNGNQVSTPRSSHDSFD